MRVLIGCEFSGTVRDAFLARGHDAMSCDFRYSEKPGPHYRGDVRDVIGAGWDLMIVHPDCTHLTVAGARWFNDPGRREAQSEALEFVRHLLAAPIPRIALENPVGVISTQIRKPDQIINPWQFGHFDNKKTCLWLKGLPLLKSTNVVRLSGDPRMKKYQNTIHYASPGPDRAKFRSRTYQGFADAFASQWG